MPEVRHSDLDAFSHLPNPVWVFDLEYGQTWYANRQALELFATRDLDELRARNLRDPMTSGMRRRVERLFERFHRGDFAVEEWTFYPENDRPVAATCTLSGMTIHDERGSRLAMLIQASRRDCPDTNERRLVEALRHCNERLSLYSRDGGLLLRNPAAEQAFGVGAPDADNFASSFHCAEDVTTARKLTSEGNVFRKRVPVAVAGGDAWYDTEVRQVVDPASGSKALLCVQHDVTEQHLSERRLEVARREANELRERAEAASNAKSAFLAAMSHDLRTPMTGVLAAAELLSTCALNEEQREFLDMVVEGGKQMVALVDDILDLSRIEAGRIELMPEPITFTHLISGTLQPLRAAAQRKGLRLEYRIDDDRAVDVDIKRLRQVLTNLVSNAIKFSNDGTISVTVATTGDDASRQIRLEVQDQGIGLDPTKAESLFEAFNRGAQTDHESGTGLGLYIAQSIVQAMGGTIGVNSSFGGGCTFWIQLCLPVSDPNVAPSATSRSRQRVSCCILVVDDNRLIRETISRLLRRWGCEVVIAHDGQDAIDRLDSKFDIVLMDINMPRKNGLAAAREIRARNDSIANIPMVALTADVFFQENDTPFNRTLSKPVDWDALRTMLLSLVPTARLAVQDKRRGGVA